MNYSSTEKKRFRRSFSKYSHTADIPSLLKLQRDSYHKFLQQEIAPEDRTNFGLQAAFKNVFPIYSSSGTISLEFGHYELSEPQYDMRECKERNLTYRSSVSAHIKMIVRDKKGGSISSIKEESIYMGDLPMMTDHGSFIVNGTERVVVSQLHRSPGVFFEHDAGRSTLTKKILYSARVIPYNGRWLDFEFDQRDIVYFRIDRRRKMPVTILLKAIGYSEEEILEKFYDFDIFSLGANQDEVTYRLNPEFLEKESLPFDLKTSRGVIIVPVGQRIKKAHLEKIAKLPEMYPVDDSFLLGKRLAKIIVDSAGEIVAKANSELDEEVLINIRAAGVTQIETLHTNELNRGPYIAETLALDEKLDRELSRNAIYRMLRPGDPPSPDVVNTYLDGIFFSSMMYDMSRVGRMKFNRRLAQERPPMEYRIFIKKEGLTTKRVVRDVAENLVEAGCMATIDEALALLNYIIQSESRTVERVEFDESELRARSVFKFSFKAENLTEEEAKAYSEKLSRVPHEILEQTILSRKDIMAVVMRLVALRNGKGGTDDIDSLTNRRVRTVGEFVANHFEQGLRRVDRAIRDRLSRADTEGLMPHELISAKAISSSVSEFFNGNQLSQFMDQTNPLSEITHKRRVSAFGAGGLTRDRVGFEVRDVHPTHYGRICPIETPEGQNIGLINSMALYSDVDSYGFLQTNYRAVKDGKIGKNALRLSAIEEEGKIIVQASVNRKGDELADDVVLARKDGEYLMVSPKEVDYIDVSPAQISSAAASMIPFLEHDDANRALMGSNMQRQAVPCLVSEKPLVGTGVERRLAMDSGAVICARRAGQVSYVDASRIVVSADDDSGDDVDVDIYSLTKHVRSNQNTDINQRPIVQAGDKISTGDIIADGIGTDLGELSLGQNLLVAFMPWNGFNFEDSILISERVVAEQRFASVHIIEEIAHARSTPLGNEEVTRDIPHQSERALRNLDEEGIVRIGVEVNPGDILVGKITPKGERQMSPEEKLLQAVFGDKANDFKDNSMRMPPGAAGVVIDVKVFTSDDSKVKKEPDSKRAAAINKEDLQRYKDKSRDELMFIKQDAMRRILELSGKSKTDKISLTEAFKIRVKNKAANEKIEKIVKKVDDFEVHQKKRVKDTEIKLINGHDLPQGILKTVKVYISIKRNLQVGDKMAGRHGNKGVVSKVEAVESMPYMASGKTVDIVLNPLGVPSRMNVGQILETHLGFAAKGLGEKLEVLLQSERKKNVTEIRAFLEQVYDGDNTCKISDLTDDETIEMAKNLSSGVPFATPIFDGANETQIERMLKLADLPKNGQVILYDGRSGEAFARPVTVGYMYIMKLHHLVDEKMHSRSTGPYSLITQQPLGGKAQRGGQRFGEMEVWALEAYGAAYTLCEMLTIKSDDVGYRGKMFEDIASGDYQLKSGVPESFNVLVQELRAMCIDMDFE